ncbi:HAD family hydrolase [Herbidospora mongoliensis]|uniref:HAD family hydrolase n=1 Tax=Herbidospora mongoliensis TaxID=688067 RepID=UPI000A066E32|nr:HAD family hydrolase [Herbidospora mongoliensis]
MTHIVWDWNGTLFHDSDAVVSATNEIFRTYGVAPIDLDGFRGVYCRPIWVAYERIIGRALEEGEWERLDEGFHLHYHQFMEACLLAEGAPAILAAWGEAGRSQSLLSMWQHERLVPKIAEFGIDHHFTRVDGLRLTSPGGHKAEHMAEHMKALDLDPADIVMIGDSVDDGIAARHVGARAILYTGGMTSRAELASLGFPVVDSLSDAMDLI